MRKQILCFSWYPQYLHHRIYCFENECISIQRIMRYSKKQKAWIGELFFKNSESIVAVQRKFASSFYVGELSRKCINGTVLRFKESDSSTEKKYSGRPKTVRTPAVLHRVSESVAKNPRTSIRKRWRSENIIKKTLFSTWSSSMIIATHSSWIFEFITTQNSSDTIIDGGRSWKEVGVC